MKVSRVLRGSLSPAAVVLFFLMPAPALSQTPAEPLSLSRAIAIARENNPDYLTQRNQLRAAAWEVRSAYGSLLPSLSSSTSFGYTATGERRLDTVVLDQQPAQYSSRYSLGMSLSLSGTTLLAPSVARAQERAAEETVEGAGASLEADVSQRYLTVLEAREAVEQAERELARTEEHVRLAQARLEVGAGTQLDVSRAEVQRGQAEVRLVQALNTAANERLMLGQIMGTRLPDDVVLSETFELFAPDWTPAELGAVALTESPVLNASRAQADAATTRARAAATSYLPTISFNANLSGYISQAGDIGPIVSRELQRAQSGFESCLAQNDLFGAVGLPLEQCSDPTLPAFQQALRQEIQVQNRGFPFDYVRQPMSASVTVSLPIFTGLTRQQQVEEARIARLNAEYQVRTQEIRTEVEVETALRNLQTAYRSALLQQQIRETSEEELRLAQERFRFGATTSVEVVDAQANLAEAERAEIAAIYGFHRSLAILEAQLGQPLTPP
ncbi:MAG: TolC family protein [Gemmatimonadota bacterium]